MGREKLIEGYGVLGALGSGFSGSSVSYQSLRASP